MPSRNIRQIKTSLVQIDSGESAFPGAFFLAPEYHLDMQFCTPHWDKLKEKIKERGMWSLVSQGGEQAHAKIVSEVEEGSKKENFDPLMAAHNMIVSNALTCAGIEVLAQEGCPLCYLQNNCPCGQPDCKEKFESWLDRAADGAREGAVKLGLLPAS